MPSKSDFMILNARIFTSDEANPQAEAVAVKGNRIVFVGTTEGAKEFQDASTQVIDGKGCTLTPGFIDSHFHLLWGSIWMGGAQLYEAKTKDDVNESPANLCGAKQNHRMGGRARNQIRHYLHAAGTG